MNNSINTSFIAHIRAEDNAIQTVEEHLIDVKKLAEEAGSKVGLKHVAGLAGMLHDMGKFTHRFREYILQAVHDPENPPKRGEVDHSTAGGRILYRRYHRKKPIAYQALLAEIVGNAIISHHGNLHDYLSPELESPFLQRVRDKELVEYEEAECRFFQYVMSEEAFNEYVIQASSELEQFMKQYIGQGFETAVMFAAKFVFSALVDADRTNTRQYEENCMEEKPKETDALFSMYYDRLMAKVKSFEKQPKTESPINQLRRDMSNQCESFAENPSGIYTLSIPTGGGKTLASLRYALKHALIHQKKRIIYVVPFTTIIEQNAAVVRDILQDDESILEHHSNVVDIDDQEKQDGIMSRQEKMKLARDNWDMPIIFTTMVQFLNVFYAKGNRNTRRLHQLSEAIIIFDEVQKVPIKCVSLFNKAVNFLTETAKSSVVLCTATQPALDYVEYHLNIKADAEMIQQIDDVADAFKRVEIANLASGQIFNTERLSKFIVEQMNHDKSILVILNTKTVVKRLYELFKTEKANEFHLFHLSTSMCAAHRAAILEEIRNCLKKKERVICFSTQLIEAGVDVSFECVIRSVSGLDSIAQAAGRCNRHGEFGIKTVYIIDHEEERLSRLKEIEKGKKIVLRMLEDMKRDPSSHGGNLLSRVAMERYFKEFYKELGAELNYFVPAVQDDLVGLLTRSPAKSQYVQAYSHKNRQEKLPLFLANSYLTAAEYFQVIDQQTESILVPYGEGQDIIAELNGDRTIADYGRLMRKAQQYSINVYDYEKQKLIEEDGLVSLMNGSIWALKKGAYNEDYGLDLKNNSVFGDFLSI